MTKHIPIIVLSIAVAVLYVLHFAQDTSVATTPVAPTKTTPTFDGGFPIAYVNLDSLLFSYDLYNDLKTAHEAKYKAAEGQFQSKAETLQRDIYQFQEKTQKGLMTRADAEAQEQELQRRQQDLMQLEQTLTKELSQKEEQMQKRIYDSIQVVLKQYNNDSRYRLILNNAFNNNLLDADENLNITDTILSLLNSK